MLNTLRKIVRSWPLPEQIAAVVTERFPAVPGILRTQTLTAFRAYSRRDLEQAWDIGVE